MLIGTSVHFLVFHIFVLALNLMALIAKYLTHIFIHGQKKKSYLV